MDAEIMKAVEGLSEEDAKAILATQFPEELEKEAEAELAESDLADALYAYGALTADRHINEVDGVEKVAAEVKTQLDEAEAEITSAIDSGLADLGYTAITEPAEMHKAAQAAAGIIFEGYSDFLEKEAAAKPGAVKSLMEKGKHAIHEARKLGKKHSGKAMMGAAGAGFAAGHMSKKASEYENVGEMYAEFREAIVNELNAEGVIAEGVEKLAAKAHKKALTMAKKFGKKVMKHGKKYAPHMGAAAAGAGAAHAAHKMSKKD